MPLPSSSPKPSHYASPIKLETNSKGTASSPPPSSSKERRHKKKHHHSSGKQRSEAPLTWKEQLFQVAAIFLTAVVVYKLTLTGVRWLEETRRPFCDDLQDPVRDNCRLCPENGICRDGDFRCIPGFRRQGARCVPDKQIDRNAQNLAEFVQSKVCGISGESLCRSDVTTWVQEQELWDTSKEADLGLDAESVWLVREKALQLVRDKLNIRIDDFGSKEFECPFALAVTYQPIGCRLRKGIKANIYGILLSTFIVISVAVYILRSLEYRRLANRAEELYMQVEGLVQEDSRIDQYPKLVNGDSRVVWEWQGEGTLRTPTKDMKR